MKSIKVELETNDRFSFHTFHNIRNGIYELHMKYETSKTPKQEIEKAIKIKEAYYADKQS